jgi:hypothetical protein
MAVFAINTYSQQAKTVYISKLTKRFINKYRNYTVIDSLILYKDQTFIKRLSVHGF